MEDKLNNLGKKIKDYEPKLPEEIKLQKHYTHGYSEDKSTERLTQELVEGFNQLVRYLREVKRQS